MIYYGLIGTVVLVVYNAIMKRIVSAVVVILFMSVT